MLLVVSALILLQLSVVEGALAQDRVDSLPGLTWNTTFKQYSGYLNATGTRKLHYWFLTSQREPDHYPLVLWLNGGPGCSSLDGLLSEHGPFQIQDDGKTLKENPYSWNRVANMLYLEAPAGVGFSYSDDKQYATSDDQVAADNYAALKSFLKGFPEFAKNDFYITGESYGGVYVPTLAVKVLDDPAFNFKGFAVGNGLSSRDNNTNSLIYYAYYHGLIDTNLWDQLKTNCCPADSNGGPCDFPKGSGPDCISALDEVNAAVGARGMNIYNLFGDCYYGSLQDTYKQGDRIVYHDFGWMGVNSRATNKFRQQLGSYDVSKLKLVPPCIDASGLETYLNRPEVRKALHIPDFVQKWEICSAIVGMGYKAQYNTLQNQYLKILSTKKQRIMVYNGDGDMACNFLGDEWFVEGLQQKVTKSIHAWYYPKAKGVQVGGFVKEYENIVFVTVKGAGHMVPQDKPEQALTMIRNFLQDVPW